MYNSKWYQGGGYDQMANIETKKDKTLGQRITELSSIMSERHYTVLYNIKLSY